MTADKTSSGDLTLGERELLADARVDDVSFGMVLDHLGIWRDSAPSDWRPTQADIDAAFTALERLVERGLVAVGRTEYIDGGPPGRVAPVRHVPENLDIVRARVEAAVQTATRAADWAYSCWVVSVK